MKFSPQQEQALDAVGRWLTSGDQVFRLFGYAGTGKTTLARHLAEGVGSALFAAFTGKAAYVLRQMGCPGASTIHKLIYKPRDKSRLRLIQLEKELRQLHEGPGDPTREVELEREIAEERENLKRPAFTLNLTSPLREADLLVVDECSMVDERIGQDILSFGTKVLVLGDPAQLPPVAGCGFFTERSPDHLLTEIHRQARDNPIIDLATTVREGGRLEEGLYGESRIMDWADIEPEDGLEADQVLLGTNRLRRGTNARLRELLGRSGRLPEAGDRLVCLRNDHDVGLLNGAIWTVRSSTAHSDDFIDLELEPEGEGDEVSVKAHTAHFLGYEVPWYERKKAQEFDYGYALTVHKAQGSQWENVLVLDQSRTFRNHAARWLYTAITRASRKVTVARDLG